MDEDHNSWKMVDCDIELRCYGHPPIAPPNLGANLTLFECHEPLFHTCHESLHQINENKNASQKYP